MEYPTPSAEEIARVEEKLHERAATEVKALVKDLMAKRGDIDETTASRMIANALWEDFKREAEEPVAMPSAKKGPESLVSNPNGTVSGDSGEATTKAQEYYALTLMVVAD